LSQSGALKRIAVGESDFNLSQQGTSSSLPDGKHLWYIEHMDNIEIIKEAITLARLKEIAKQRFGDMVKGVVDIEKNIIAFGGELHADEEAALLEDGSEQKNLWGINIYVDEPKEEWIEFDSMINIRPSQDNNSRTVEDENIKKRIVEIVETLVK